MKIWNGIDDLDFYVDTMVVPEEAEKFTHIYRINAFRVKANDLDVDADEIYGKENKKIRDEPEEVPMDKLLLDGMDWDFLGDRCILKGIRRPCDNTRRYMATRRVNTSRIKMAKTVGGCYNTINRGENGKTSAQNEDEWKSSIVATKKKPKSDCSNYFKKADRRKTRHEGKTECREIPDVFMDDAEEERREFYKEKADGTVDVDFCLRHNWLYADLDDGIYGDEYDEEEDDYEPEYMSREWCEMECIDYPGDDYDEDDEEEEVALTYAENSRLKREINLYKGFIEEFNLGKLYQTWLDQKGN